MTATEGGQFSVGGRFDWRYLCGAAVLALALAVAAAAVPGVVATDDQPGNPVSIYGEAEDELGNTPEEGTEIYALVDGEVESKIAVDENGQFGGGDAFDRKLAINDGAGSEVVFTVDSPNGTVALDSLDLDAADEVESLSLTFPVASFATIDATDDGNLASDTTNNGLLNDVDGDGDFDIFDVQALFNNLESAPVQTNPEAFNFNGNPAPTDVTIFDVQGLFKQLD
jgi:hypothetical protein